MKRQIFFYPERCLLCQSCVLACGMNTLSVSDPRRIPRNRSPLQKIHLTFSRGTPWVWKCQHCTTAPCVEACISGSLPPAEEGTGVILHPETCVGCGSCLLACPYEALRYDEREERVTKCNLCPGHETPPCVGECPTQALACEEPNFHAQKKRKRFAQEMGKTGENG